jgi:hypothetical protein
VKLDTLLRNMLGLGRPFSGLILPTFGGTPWPGHRPVARPLLTHNKHSETCIPGVGFEPTTLVFEQTATDCALRHCE